MDDSREKIIYRQWPHAPSHLFLPKAAYIVTARTYTKGLLFNTAEKKDFLLASLFDEAQRFHWRLEAWAVMANHYHFVAQAPEDARNLETMLRTLHSKTARWVNQQDGADGRQVWFQYRDTCLTHEKSYFARLHYVHANPVKHCLVDNAEQYRWCSMSWFAQGASPAFRKMVLSFKTDRVNVPDDFDVVE